MRVKMTHQVTGTRNGVSWPDVGSEIDLPDSEAADLCAAKLATPVAQREEVAKVETRDVEGPEVKEPEPKPQAKPRGSRSKKPE